MPNLSYVCLGGAGNHPDEPASREVYLDIELLGALAPGARQVVIFARNTWEGWLEAMAAAAHSREIGATIISTSWGSPEGRHRPDVQKQMDGLLADAAARGVTVIGASGDLGATDGSSDGSLQVDFPACSPYVLGAGATSLRLNPNGSIAEQTVWNDPGRGQASGGGYSRHYPAPDYQIDALTRVGKDPGTCGRGVPDVAGVGDFRTGWLTYVPPGGWRSSGGTSAAAPFWAAVIALLAEGLGERHLGLINPHLYELAGTDAFDDIISGNNILPGESAGYSAGPYWNPCTGIGAPDVLRLLTALIKRFNDLDRDPH